MTSSGPCIGSTATSSPLGFVDAVRIINLRTRTDRRRDMEAELGRIGAALDNDTVAFFCTDRPSSADGFPSTGAKGCYFAHLDVLRLARDRGWESIAIFEDDLQFSADFSARIASVSRSLVGADWQMFYGGHRVPEDAFGASCGNDLFRGERHHSIVTAHFICFRGRETIDRAVALLEAFASREPGDPRGGPMHVDGAYNWLRVANPEWLCLLAKVPLGHQRSSRSDIAALRWWDRAAILAPLAQALRRVRASVRRR